MAKKKKIFIPFILSIAAALFGVVAIVMLAAPAISYTVEFGALEQTTSYTLAQLTFGTDKGGFAFSFMNLLPDLLAAIGIALSILAAVKGNKFCAFIAAACFLAAGIFFFCCKQLVVFDTGELTGDAKDIAVNTAKEALKNFKLAAGSIMAGILSFLAAIAAGSAAVFGRK